MSESIYGERDLDRQVAEALGWRWVTDTSRAASGRRRFLAREPSSWKYFEEASADLPLYADWYSDTPKFSTDPAAYMGLLEEMDSRGYNFSLSGSSPFSCSLCKKGGGNYEVIRWDQYPSPGEAICRAVLAALKDEQ